MYRYTNKNKKKDQGEFIKVNSVSGSVFGYG